MYYPLLRARQFELIALRDLANTGASQGCIVPILEPVKESFNNLKIALTTFASRNQQAVLLVNPIVGDLYGDHALILDYLQQGNFPVTRAFYYRNNTTYILDSIEEYNLQNCMIICQNDINPDDVRFKDLIESEAVQLIVVEDPGRNRALDRYVRNLDKTYIRLDDFFEKQQRNSDFLDIQEHRFSEEHLHYLNENFNGFSDYTVLPSEYSDSGSTPRAVVIHLTYMKGDNQIWIRHFTSDTNDSIANVQGKFAEAAEKAVQFCRGNNLNNAAIAELEDYYNRQHYPGLGTVKKISLKNHLLIVQDYLSHH
ncbi:sce7725 family protein [Muricauda oceani]|uniref:Sce7725 family protein n=1 Tax=Flagellimonas oceani TaxID=2698672 RepID=A0A6G7J5X3_9FLAO|nr:sce7725 family protein [Allomuricauda oceani]MBW8242503.1 sce7725 family protein [Allomuricauda oceani]QII46263.1 sce7725 family protein [Allomuricauda oceani]